MIDPFVPNNLKDYCVQNYFINVYINISIIHHQSIVLFFRSIEMSQNIS